jgi:hypothetical protein
MTPTHGKSLSTLTGIVFTWISITALIPFSIILVTLWKGRAAFDLLLMEGPFSYLPITLSSVTMTWLLIGLFLILLRMGKINQGNLATWVGFLLVSFLYLNVLRDRLTYGDVMPYLRGAAALLQQRSFSHTYIYPPLWAILLQPLVKLGTPAATNILWVFNVLALCIFYFLGTLILRHYGFPERMSAIVMSVFMLVNVPILRTMFYMQVNLHVLNLIIFSLLIRRRSAFLSALAMAIAIHLKFSPALLVLAFLLERDWRWLAWLAVTASAIFGLTLLTNGFSPYTDFIFNLGLLNQPLYPNFRNTSFDSLLWPLVDFLNISSTWVHALIYAGKAVLAISIFFIIRHTIKNRSLYDSEMPFLFNTIPALMILMTMASPLVWEHHGVFLTLPFLLLLKKLETPPEWAWFCAAYFLEFFLPTFDFYPWSYGRLAATLIILGLLWITSKRREDNPLFSAVGRWMETMPAVE